MTKEYIDSLIRGTVGGVIAGGVQFFAVAPFATAEHAFYAAGAAAFGFLAIRMGIEGTIDSRRANTKP